jgi:Tol biopolymer transport system component
MCGGMMVLVALAPAFAQQPATPAPPAPAQQPAAPPATDIYLLPLDNVQQIARAKLVAIATEKGYENQPSFTTDGGTVLFTANRDGKQTDAWAWNRGAARARALWSTPEAEYSPTLTPDDGYSVIRVEADGTQRLWRFDRKGENPRVLLNDIKPVGYHAWVDKDVLGLFVLGQPATLQLAKVSTGKAEVVASGIGRSLHRVPGSRAISFVQREDNDEYWVKQIDVDSRRIEPLVKVLAASADRDVAWMPDGKTLLLSAGTQIYRWQRGEKEWTSILDVTRIGLGTVSRLAVSPTGDALAIVVTESK